MSNTAAAIERFVTYSRAVLANPAPYGAVRVAKATALIEAVDAGDDFQIKALVLDW